MSVRSSDLARESGVSVTRRVLVVDDDLDTLEMLEEMLTRLGHQVATAAEAGEALSSITSFKPDVVLLDILLPDVTGLELLPRLRAAQERPCRFIALSGMARAQDMERAMAAGFNAYLTKPFRMSALLSELGYAAG